MTLNTYYAPPDRADEPAEEPEPVDDRHSIKFGYNLADLDRFARRAVARSRGNPGQYRDRYEAAWSAIAEHLCAAEEAPNAADLVYSGWRAAMRYLDDIKQTDGWDHTTGRTMPRFCQYWTPGAASALEDHVVDRLALWEILATLTPRRRQAITALASTDEYTLAAAAMGMSPGGYVVTLNRARASFLALWHEGETPSKPWRRDRRVYSRDGTVAGRPRLTVSQVEKARDRYTTGETLTALAVEYGVSETALSNLVRGRHKPAPDPEES